MLLPLMSRLGGRSAPRKPERGIGIEPTLMPGPAGTGTGGGMRLEALDELPAPKAEAGPEASGTPGGTPGGTPNDMDSKLGTSPPVRPP